MISNIPEEFDAYIVNVDEAGRASAAVGNWRETDLIPRGTGDSGEKYPVTVDIRVEYSCLNYKDALSASGHRGISPNFPHIPGIDALGNRLDTGDAVAVTGFDLGMGTPGGFGQYIRVPEDWVIPLPAELSFREAAALGTAGVTAALCIDALYHDGLSPEAGPVVVSGATGGVGSIAVEILARLGHEVHAVTGKTDSTDWLRHRGAARVIDRREFVTRGEKALLRPEYAGAVDTVGGAMLHRILRSLSFGGTATACGMVTGTDLKTNIYPFILRGTGLRGIASADTPREIKARMWELLAGPWRVEQLFTDVREVGLDGLPEEIDRILAGGMTGRVVVRTS